MAATSGADQLGESTGVPALSSNDPSAHARSLLASFLKDHPDANVAALRGFATEHPDEATQLTTLFKEVEELKALVDLPAHVIAAHLQEGDWTTSRAGTDSAIESPIEVGSVSDASPELGAVFELVERGEEGWTRTRALAALVAVCEEVASAHSKGVLHLDLKPSNVLVGRFGEVCVVGWGLATELGGSKTTNAGERLDASKSAWLQPVRSRQADGAGSRSPSITPWGEVIRTPAYMPPEQAAGTFAHVKQAADVYAVGAILYRLLAGRAPYEDPGVHETAREVLLRVVEGPPTPLRVLRPSLPPELEAICSKAMARRIGDRYLSMEGMADDLRAYLEGRVVGAHEAGAWAEARKWMQRNKPLAVSLAAAVLLLVGGLVTSFLY